MVEVKRPVRDLLAALVRIVDNDLDELRGNIVHVDELTARRTRQLNDAIDGMGYGMERLDKRISELEAVLADNAQHSRKAGEA